MEIAREAQGKGFVINPHGSDVDRAIDTGYGNVNPRNMVFNLKPNRSGSGGRGRLRDIPHICPDGVVCLKSRGEAISIDAAGRKFA